MAYAERKEKIIDAARWVSPWFFRNDGTFVRGRILRMTKNKKGVQFLLFTQAENLSLFIPVTASIYCDFITYVSVGDVIISTITNDGKGAVVTDFQIAALCIMNPEELNYFNHNIENYTGDALHKRVCGSRAEIESYRILSETMNALHCVMADYEFLQIITPCIQKEFRGGYARPYITNSNHHRQDVFLRVSAEIHHKQLIVSGIERVYEVVLSFRNESANRLSRNAFNLVEVEAAYSDESLMFKLLYDILIRSGKAIKKEVPEYTVGKTVEQLLEEKTGKRITQITELRHVTPYCEMGDDIFNLEPYRIVNIIFKRYIMPDLKGLVVIQDMVENYSPFVQKGENEVFRWFVIWEGIKIGEVYRSETDVLLQEKGLVDICSATKRDISAYNNYLHSQYCGMPPVAVMSIGIERIIMLLAGKKDLHLMFE